MRNLLRPAFRTLCAMALLSLLFLGAVPLRGETLSAGDAEGEESLIYLLLFTGDREEEWLSLAEQYEERSGIPVTIRFFSEKTYDEAMLLSLAEEKKPTILFLSDRRDAYVFEDYLWELRELPVFDHIRFPSRCLFYNGRAVGAPFYAGDEPLYFAFCNEASEESLSASQRFLSWVALSGEGDRVFPEAGFRFSYE